MDGFQETISDKLFLSPGKERVREPKERERENEPKEREREIGEKNPKKRSRTNVSLMVFVFAVLATLGAGINPITLSIKIWMPNNSDE